MNPSKGYYYQYTWECCQCGGENREDWAACDSCGHLKCDQCKEIPVEKYMPENPTMIEGEAAMKSKRSSISTAMWILLLALIDIILLAILLYVKPPITTMIVFAMFFIGISGILKLSRWAEQPEEAQGE